MNHMYHLFDKINTTLLKCMAVLMITAALPALLVAQTAPTDGMKDNTPNVHAFTNATIVTAPGQTINNATLVIRDGVIEAVGRRVSPPSDARVWDMEGKTLYPGFIDSYSDVGMNEPRVELDRGNNSWNPNLRSHLKAEQEFDTEDDGNSALRSQGFTAALSMPPLGIFKGEAAVISLKDGDVSDRVVMDRIAQGVSLSTNRDFGFTYPTSQIGVIALIRQTLYDADWYERAHEAYRSNPSLERPESNAPLASLRDAVHGDQPLIFHTESDEEILRALRFKDEFSSINPWILGNGHEYKVLDVLSEHNAPLILPLDYPEAPDVETPEDALSEDLAELRHWYLAPENPARVADAGVLFSFTTAGLEKPGDFLGNLRKAVQLGLDKETALAALTSNPASLLGIDSTHGTLEAGKAANIIVADGDLFENGAKIIDLWVDGSHYRINPEKELDPRGEWEIVSTDGSIDGTLVVEESRPGRLNGTVTINGDEIDLMSASMQDQARRFRADFSGNELGLEGPVRLTGSVDGDNLRGWAEVTGRDRVQFSATRTGSVTESESEDSAETMNRDLQLSELRPAMEYGRNAIPEQPRNVIVRNATIWTMGPEGILENADMIISNGEVEEIGQDLRAPRNAVEIDAEGKHVTPGLIDAHIHSGVNGVNEVGNVITAEVRMGDVLNINNIWMYRQIAGGLTTAHVMHGSANPIGGQNVHIKMRWGSLSDDLKIDDAPRTVKFALGENPKRVGSDRYPETRMGTEQMIEDRFRMARDYEARWNEWNETGEGIPPRKDLRLDALRDILNGDILVQSHSYRQDEILMLMRLAERFDFTIKAFHHGVEAYKVAPELAEHGAGAVVWSDWSSFKMEAQDGILYNAKLLTEAGVLTSLHSDNSQIASRMNWEAAKMVRAGMDPEDALSLVTISTAKLLGVDHRVGSLENGKDADFVIWNGDPLSTLTKAEQTWIDGRKYFDLDEDRELRQTVEEERAQLIRLIMEEK
ncbi:amidohydrolase family protein [Rhodohalobacter barkolensis]|uniref:Amidohydrolase n=1 Tax=Rhodohalobacter barkolensis TaxID=2053187 RepID=A0A2N0VJH3_9BACT|nr:amidohydrolase family protein [Rhodohalobacter barkolensis]PKD44304.1 amidohydrolase [Rhodohalobacter barkolensis]